MAEDPQHQTRDATVVDPETGRMQRTYEWTPENETEMGSREFLDRFQKVARGDAPHQPFDTTLGYRYLEVETGRILLQLTTAEHLLQSAGNVHGGVLATLIDTAGSFAVATTIPKERRAPTIQMNVQYLKSVTGVGIELRAEGRVTSRGRRLVTAEADVKGVDGTVYAMGTVMCMMREPAT